MCVAPRSIAKPTSTWQSRQVKRARWRQWSKATAGTPALCVPASRMTCPYWCAGTLIPKAAPRAQAKIARITGYPFSRDSSTKA